MDHYKITTPRTAHYFTIGTANKSVKNIWIACHGYGQLARFFLRRFDVLDDGKTLIIAPEGLSRFYTEGLSGKVGASWMTKEDRLDEIADYCLFLQGIYDHYVNLINPDAKITLLGFSQGCATIMRWMTRNFPRFDQLILWAGLLPDDLDYKPFKDYFSDKPMWWVHGDEDPFLTPELMDWHLNFAKSNKIEWKTRQFQGAHEINRDILKEFAF